MTRTERLAAAGLVLAALAACSAPWPDGSIDDEVKALDAPVAWNALALGEGRACGLATDGRAYCWGAAPLGTLKMTGTCSVVDPYGNGYEAECSVRPVEVSGDHRFTSLASSVQASLAVDGDGRLWGWGFGTVMGLPYDAQGRPAEVDYPRQVSGTEVWRFARVALGPAQLACGVTTGHQLVCWGDPGPVTTGEWSAACGAGCLSAPHLIGTGSTWVDVAVGTSHACALDEAGAVSCWGDGTSNQLGSAAAATCPGASGKCQPLPAPIYATGQTFTRLSAQGNQTCALTGGGLGYCWGKGYTNLSLPGNVGGSWKAISPTQGNVCGITGAGALSCLGPYYVGFVPAGVIPSAETFVDLATTVVDVCALSERHEAWCIGDASWGALGAGEDTAAGFATKLFLVAAPYRY